MYYRKTEIKIVFYWHTNRRTNQQNRLYSPEVNQCKHGQLIFYKNAKNIHRGNIVSVINYVAKTRYLNTKVPFLTVIKNLNGLKI